jgi:phosphoenolpyruvate carboxykinase (GTP)
MADYWSHWLAIGRRKDARLPRIFYVNWFRKSAGGDFLWPGYGENSRVLKWIFERCEGTAKARETVIGNLPAAEHLDLDGLEVSDDDLRELLSVDAKGWLHELPQLREYYAQFGARMPKELVAELDALEKRLEAAR